MQIARTVAEAHLYMDIAGCEPERSHKLKADGDVLITVYQAICNGNARTFMFRVLEGEIEAEGGGVVFGREEHSTLLDPAQFLLQASAIARTVPASPAGLDDEKRREATRRMLRAAACLDEALKYIPEGEDDMPRTAFHTIVGARMHKANPDRFSWGRIGIVRQSYRNTAERHRAGS